MKRELLSLAFLLNLPISHTAGYKIRLIIEYKSKKIATNIILIINFLHSDKILYIIVYNILGNKKDKILKKQLDILINLASKRAGPFDEDFTKHWYHIYEDLTQG